MRFSYPSGSNPLVGFTIERGIGIGGFGEVYSAINDAGKIVALKKIQRNLDIELRGVRQCINLKHVNLITLWDIRSNDHGESWVVMEYVPGPSLRDIVEAHPYGMPDHELKRWFLSMASGVAYLHQKDIVHRDLKPGNIFLDEDSQVIKIGDYGLSKFISTSRRSGQTESVGTFHYMAPEIGRGVYGKEIDIYAMGILLFEMLTGDVPFDGESAQEIIMKHLTDDPKLERVPDEFHDVIRMALEKDPELRYHSVPEMLAQMPWPEVAANSENIASQHSVGAMVPETASAKGPLTQTKRNSSKSNPEEITVHHASSKADDTALQQRGNVPMGANGSRHRLKLPPVMINGADVEIVQPKPSDIVFGPLQDRSHYGDSNGGELTPEMDVSDADSIRFIESQRSDEPIARAVSSAIANLGNWWTNANVSTPVKVVLLTVASLVVLKNSQWLLPLAVGLGLVYLAYYTIRSWLRTGESDGEPERDGGQSTVEPTVSPVAQPPTKPPSKRELKRRSILQIRAWIAHRPMMDRLTELLGSLLVAALACLVFNLLGLAVSGSILDASIESWAIYAWLTTTSVSASWLLLVISKFWEDRVGENTLRRFMMLSLGLAVGATAFYSASVFNINLADATTFDFSSSENSRFVIKGMPMLPAYLIFFAGLFGILRWWLQADPVRSTRLSLINVSLCLIWASVLSHLLEVPLTHNCILAVVISVSVQLAAPWLHPDKRLEIGSRHAESI